MEIKSNKKEVQDEDGFVEMQEKSKMTCNVRSCWICNENYHPRKYYKTHKRQFNSSAIPRKFCMNNCQFCFKLVSRLQNQENSNSGFKDENYFTVFF